jgi:hypothetical protein
LQDCNWTEEMAKEKILKFPTADPSNVAQRAFLPNKLTRKLLKKRQKEMPRNVMASTKRKHR